MYQALFHVTIAAYVAATGLALAYLVQRGDLVYRIAALTVRAAWMLHTIAIITLVAETREPPLGNLTAAVWMSVWVVVLLEVLIEHYWRVHMLGAFVLPVVVVLLVFAVSSPLSLQELGPAFRSAWIWVHISVNLVGIAAFVLNFAGASMYLLQERQLKAKRPGTFSYRLPALETLDRLTYRTLAIGFPFLTVGMILGAMWVRTAWGGGFFFDPLAFFSVVAWAIYAGTLAGRTAAHLHGRRAAYCAILGFAVLVLTLGAGLFLPGKHGS